MELRAGHILQFHAYCERHRDCTEDIGDLLAKLITRPIRLLVGRDDMRRFGTVAKHLPDYTTAAEVIRDIAALAVGYCNKGLRTCKTEPPDYNYKHLQVLQLILSYVPQLEKVYALPPTPAQDLVNDKKLFRRLERAFNPPRYLAKYPGPFSQQHTCDVCLDPFHERQHLFYCSGATSLPFLTSSTGDVRSVAQVLVNANGICPWLALQLAPRRSGNRSQLFRMECERTLHFPRASQV